jgi:hypothetical protein
MKTELVAGDYLQVDETPVRVMDPDLPGKCAQAYLWVAGQPKGNVIFEFYQGRGQEQARQLIGSFQGYLQRDGYSAYGALVRTMGGLLPVGCWAHARRKFVEAADLGQSEAAAVIEQLLQLYLVERLARDQCLSPKQRKELRAEKSVPLLNYLRLLIENTLPKVLPQSPYGKAARYCLNEWEALNRYVEDGRLEIDNNLTENAIRPSAVGKKNWLFIGHPDAGWRSAVIYSIVVSCQRRRIDPAKYLTDVLQRLPLMKQSELTTL